MKGKKNKKLLPNQVQVFFLFFFKEKKKDRKNICKDHADWIVKIIGNYFTNNPGYQRPKMIRLHTHTHHEHFRDGFKEVHELVEAVVAEFALPAEVVVVGRDELIEGHPAVGLVAQKIHHLFSKLLGALNLLHSALCREAQATFN